MAKGPSFRDGNAARHRARMEQNTKAIAKYGNRGEPMVVPTYQLAPVLREWCVRWLEARPQGRFGHQNWVDRNNGGQADFVGPVQYLSFETGINTRRVSGVIREEFTHIGEQQAELLLLAIDREYLLSNGEIRAYPNPNWSLEKWLDWRREQGCV